MPSVDKYYEVMPARECLRSTAARNGVSCDVMLSGPTAFKVLRHGDVLALCCGVDVRRSRPQFSRGGVCVESAGDRGVCRERHNDALAILGIVCGWRW